jgi:uncharacterized delta-60 repeat protein
MKVHLPVTLSKKNFTAFIVCFLLSITQSFAQVGTLDSSFGVNGEVLISLDSPHTAVSRVTAIQDDGKIIVAGWKYFYHSLYDISQRGFVLSRLLPNGNLDSSFGINGNVIIDIDSTQDFYIHAIAIQPDGKIVLGGLQFNDDAYLVRYKTNGQVDSTFGTNGHVVTNLGASYDEILSLAIQQDGKIIEGGSANPMGSLIRYNTDGSIDNAFANGLKSTLEIVDLKITSDGKIITTSYGEAPSDTTESLYFQVRRYLSNGTIDATFGDHGDVYFDFLNNSSKPRAVALLKNNDIIIAGAAYTQTGASVCALAKVKSNGTLDSSFGINGKVTTNLDASYSILANSVFIQNDGKIIITTGERNGTANFKIARFQANGLLDSAFGSNKGYSILNLHSSDPLETDEVNPAAIQKDGKVVIVGVSSSGYFCINRIKVESTISIQKNISILEGNSGTKSVTFKIVLNQISKKTITVNFATVDGTAEAGQDYVAASGALTFKPGKISKNVIVNIVGDNVAEPNEKFFLQLNNPKNAILGTLSTATCTIKNDDPSLSSATSSEIATAKNIKLYPNPATDFLRIEGLNKDAHTTITILDMQGRVFIKTIASNSTCSLNIKTLPAGAYYIRIVTGETTTFKFVKE